MFVGFGGSVAGGGIGVLVGDKGVDVGAVVEVLVGAVVALGAVVGMGVGTWVVGGDVVGVVAVVAIGACATDWGLLPPQAARMTVTMIRIVVTIGFRIRSYPPLP